MKARIAGSETLDGKMRQITRQVIRGLKRRGGGAVECPSHARAVALITGEILDLFAQVFETLSGECRYG
jgi:hypothetical protein